MLIEIDSFADYQHGIDIKPYITLKKITKEEYFKIASIEFKETKE